MKRIQMFVQFLLLGFFTSTVTAGTKWRLNYLKADQVEFDDGTVWDQATHESMATGGG